jgi:hypothetical protein
VLIVRDVPAAARFYRVAGCRPEGENRRDVLDPERYLLEIYADV